MSTRYKLNKRNRLKAGKPIVTEAEYQAAMSRYDSVMDRINSVKAPKHVPFEELPLRRKPSPVSPKRRDTFLDLLCEAEATVDKYGVLVLFGCWGLFAWFIS